MHEQSETIQDESGRWINVYGKPAKGLTLPLEPGVTYPDTASAVEAAKIRSQMHVPHDEMTLSEMLRALSSEQPAQVEALSRRPIDMSGYQGPIVWQSGDPKASMRTIPPPHMPSVYPDREAPPLRNRDMYGRSRK